MDWDFSLNKKPLFDDSIVADKKPTICEKPGWSALSIQILESFKPDNKNFIICRYFRIRYFKYLFRSYEFRISSNYSV